MGQSTRNLITEGVMFNHDTPWKNIYIFYFIQKCYDNQELDIFKIKFCKKSPVFFPFGLEELIIIYLYFAYLIINSKVHSVFSWPSSYSQQNIYLTSRVKIWQNQTIQETWQTLQKIPATFLSLFLRKQAKPASFLCFVLALLWIVSGRMKIVHMLCLAHMYVSHSRRGNFLTFFSFAVYENP